MPNYLRLREVLDSDVPTYGGLSDEDAATQLMVEDKSYDLPRMSGKTVKEAFAGQASEWAAIGPEGRSEVLSLIARDDLDPHGVDALIFTQAINGVAPNALSALQTERTITTSTAFIEGLGEVKAIDVFRARSLG